MIIADGPNVYGYTIFCDDIRVEVGGKLTYVGVYQSIMFVNGTFPIALPRFAMHTFYLQKKPNVVAPKKIIVVTPGNDEGNPAITVDIPDTDEVMASANSDADARAKQLGIVDPRYVVFSSPIMVTNFVITEPGAIRVRALRDEEYIRLGALRVLPAPVQAPADPSS